MLSLAVQPPIAQPAEALTILLVEDEPRVRKVMASVLSSEGYAVVEAATAEHALAHPYSCLRTIAVLVTDVMLPGKNGRELARRLRSLIPGIKTVLVSGYGENVALLGAEQTDEMRYLPKPFSASSLIGAVRAALHDTSADHSGENPATQEPS